MVQQELVVARVADPARILWLGGVVTRSAFAHFHTKTTGQNFSRASEWSVIGDQQKRAARLYPVPHGIAFIICEGRLGRVRIVPVLCAQSVRNNKNLEGVE